MRVSPFPTLTARNGVKLHIFRSTSQSTMLTTRPILTEIQGTRNPASRILTDETKWKAILARDENFDGLFVLGVLSTGIYCRPSCPARRPMRENVRFFLGFAEAEKAGFRACLRCHPRDAGPSQRVKLVDQVSQYIDANLQSKLTLATISNHVGLSPYHLQRMFKRVLGISPREYVDSRRIARMKSYLKKGETVNDSLYNAGFTSRSRIYENVARRFGVNPGDLRRGGEGLRVKYSIISSSLGRLLVAATEKGVCKVCIGDSDRFVEKALSEEYPSAVLQRDDDSMKDWAGKFVNYLDGQSQTLKVPLDLRATAFQSRVWKNIQSIPYGRTKTYSQVAKELGQSQAARAVARACATNPVALVIPCHRVVGKDGKLHGYRWGTKRKQKLLNLEQASIQTRLKN